MNWYGVIDSLPNRTFKKRRFYRCRQLSLSPPERYHELTSSMLNQDFDLNITIESGVITSPLTS